MNDHQECENQQRVDEHDQDSGSEDNCDEYHFMLNKTQPAPGDQEQQQLRKSAIDIFLQNLDIGYFKDFCSKEFKVTTGKEFKIEEGKMLSYDEEKEKDELLPSQYEEAKRLNAIKEAARTNSERIRKNKVPSEEGSQKQGEGQGEEAKKVIPENKTHEVTVRIQNYATLATQAQAFINEQKQNQELRAQIEEAQTKEIITDQEILVQFITKLTKQTVESHEEALPKCYLDRALCFTVSKDGRFLYQGLNNGFVRCIDTRHKCDVWQCNELKGHVKKSNPYVQFRAHYSEKGRKKSKVTSIALSEDEHFLFTGSSDTTIKIWDLKCQDLFQKVDIDQKINACLNQGLLEVQQDITPLNTLKTVNSIEQSNFQQTDNVFRKLDGHRDEVTCLAVSKDSKYLYSGCKEGRILRWNLQNEPILKNKKDEDSLLQDQKDEGSQLENQNDKSLQETIYKYVEFRGHTGPVMCLALSENGTFFYSGQSSGEAVISKQNAGSAHKNLLKWNIQKRTFECVELNYNIHEINSLALFESGENKQAYTLYIASDLRNIIKYNQTMIGKDKFEILQGHNGKVNSLQISKDGQYLISGSNDSNIIRWNTQTFEKITNQSHIDVISQVVLSNDQQRVFSISRDSTLRSWMVKLPQKTEKEEGNGEFECKITSLLSNDVQVSSRQLQRVNDEHQKAHQNAAQTQEVSIERIITPIENFFEELEENKYHQHEDSIELFADQMDKFYCKVHSPFISNSKSELDQDQKQKIKIIARSLAQIKFKEFSYNALRSIILSLNGLAYKYKLHNMEAEYINIPELMIISNQNERTIMQVLKTHEEQYLKRELNIPQQQTWALTVAIRNNKVQLVNNILMYYIQDISRFKIKVLDNSIVADLININEPYTCQFLEMIRRKQKTPNSNFQRATILNGRDETIIDHSLNKNLKVTVKQEIKAADMVLDSSLSKADQKQILEDEMYKNLNKKVDTKDSLGKEVVLLSLAYSHLEDIGDEETVIFYQALLNSLSNVVLLFKTEIQDEYEYFAFFHKLRALIMWTWTVLTYIHLNWFNSHNYLTIPILTCNVLWAFYEFRMLWIRKIEHLTEVSTMVNLYLIVMVIPLLLSSDVNNKESRILTLNSITLALMNIQCLVFMNAFEKPRYLIAMIQAVFIDFIPFFTIFTTFIFLFSQLDYYQDRLDKTKTLPYLETLQRTYFVSLGQIDFNPAELPIRRVCLILYTLVLTVVMLNLLVSVISDTYSTFSQSQEEYNLRQLLDIIIESHQFFKIKNDIVKWDETVEREGGFVLTQQYKKAYKVPGIIKYKQVEQQTINSTDDKIHKLDHKITDQTTMINKKMDNIQSQSILMKQLMEKMISLEAKISNIELKNAVVPENENQNDDDQANGSTDLVIQESKDE